MLKRAALAVCCILLLGFFTGCSRYYTLIKETTPVDNLGKYNEVNLGWLDLGEERYGLYGYDEKDKSTWIKLVQEENLKTLPKYLKDFIPNKNVNGAKAKGSAPDAKGLVVKFSDVKYNQQTSSAAKILFGSMAGSDTLDVTLHFIDGASGKELYSSTVSLTSEAGTGWSSMGFEGRLNNSIYNLAYYISSHVQ